MDTISIKQGESLSIGFTFNSSYDESRIVDMLLYLDGVLIGRKSSGTLNKTTCYSAYVSSDETFIMEGYRDVILVLEDVELGVRKFIIAGVEFDKLADEFHADVDNNGYNILLELTVDETTLYGTSTLIEVLRGPSGSGVLPSGGTAGQTIIKNSNMDQDYSWGNPTQVNADWNATSGYAQILNKPNVLTVQQQVDWNATTGVTSILNKPIIITPVNSDWNSTTGLSAILNKPTYFPASDVYPWAKQPEKPQYNYSEILDHPTLISYFTNDAGYTTNMGTVTSITAGIGLTGGTITSSGTISLATQLPNGETATTQPRGDNSNKVATTAYCDNMTQPFSGVTVKPSYLNNGDGSVTIGTGEYTLNSQTDGSGYFKNYTITGGTFTLIDGVTNYIYADYNSGAPEIKNITTLSGINDLTTTPIYTLNRVGNYISVLDWDNQGFGLANKLTMRLRQTERFSVVPGGLTIGEAATRRITIGAGIVWYGATYVPIPASNSGDGTTQSKLFVYNGSSWSFSLQTQYNNSQYQGASGLVSLSGNQYGVIWVYKGVEASQDQYVVLGTNSYANLSSAQAALIPSNLPPIIPIHTILVGRIIVKNGESIATQIDNYLITGGSSAGISDHTKLSNLTWGSSGHVGTINTFAAFDSNGLAANIPTSNYYLSSNPNGYTSNLGTVTNVSTYIDTAGNDIYVETSNSTTTPQINIHIPTASATKRGALSATDWNTFNNKLSSISYNQPSNASYQMLWGSGNSVYGNSNITCNPYTGVLSATQFSGSGAGLTGLTSGQITTALGYTPKPTFTENTAFNKNFGTTTGTVLEGRTFGTAANNGSGDFIQAQSSSTQSASYKISGDGILNKLYSTGYVSLNSSEDNDTDGNPWYGLGQKTDLLTNLNGYFGVRIKTSGGSATLASSGAATFSSTINSTGFLLNGNNLTSSLSTNYLPKWNGSNFVNSLISDDGNINVNSELKIIQNYALRLGYNQAGGATLLYNPNGNLDITPRNGYNTDFRGGNVIIQSTTASTSPTTGALVVNGGIGVGGSVYSGSEFAIYTNAKRASISADAANLYINSLTSNPIKIQIDGSDKIYISTNGNVGIGHTSDQGYKLAVNGSGYFNGNVTASNFILSSDRTLKTNIQPITKDYSKLNLVSFNFKDNLDELRFGTIAQDLLSNGFSEFVTGDKEGEYKVKYIDLLIAKVAYLESEIIKLKSK